MKQMLLRALAIFEGLRDLQGLAQVTDNLGVSLHRLEDFHGALQMHQRSLSYEYLGNDRNGMVYSLSNTAWLHYTVAAENRIEATLVPASLRKSEEYYDSVMELCKSLGDVGHLQCSSSSAPFLSRYRVIVIAPWFP
jgi:hypothetical protein